MNDRGGFAEPSPEPGHHLRRQRDLRHKDNRALPQCQRFMHGFQEDFCLSAAGNAVKQKPAPVIPQARQDLSQRFLLSGGQLVSRIPGLCECSLRDPEGCGAILGKSRNQAFFALMAAWAALRRAIGTRKGEQDT